MGAVARVAGCVLLCLLVGCGCTPAPAIAPDEPAGPTPPAEPIAVVLLIRVADHFNPELSCWRVREVLAMLERLRRAYPAAALRATLELNAADAAMLDAGGVGDLVRRALEAGWLELGYDGALEPTPETTRAFLRRLPAEWGPAVAAVREFYSLGPAPVEGDAEPEPARAALVEAKFGSLTTLSGVPGPENPPALWALLELTRARVLTRAGPGPGVTAGVSAFVFMGGLVVRDYPLVVADTEPRVFREFFDGLDRLAPGHVTVVLGASSVYARRAPADYAHRHPARPQLPPALVRPGVEARSRLRWTEINLRWLLEELVPAVPGSSLGAAGDLARRLSGGAGVTVGREELYRAARYLLDHWDGAPPAVAVAGEELVLSLAQTYHLLVAALGGEDRHVLVTADPLGPLGLPAAPSGPLKVSYETVLAAARSLWPQIPPAAGASGHWAVPLVLELPGGVGLPPGAALYALATAYCYRFEDRAPGDISIPATRDQPGPEELWREFEPRPPQGYALLQSWTFRPARFRMKG